VSPFRSSRGVPIRVSTDAPAPVRDGLDGIRWSTTAGEWQVQLVHCAAFAAGAGFDPADARPRRAVGIGAGHNQQAAITPWRVGPDGGFRSYPVGGAAAARR